MALTLVFNDTFTAESDELLTARTPDLGIGWLALANSGSTNTLVNSTTDSLDAVFYSGSDSFYQINVAESQNNSQAAELLIKATPRLSPAINLKDGASGVDGYFVWFDTGSNNVRLVRLDDGVETTLQSDFEIEGATDTLYIKNDGIGNITVKRNDVTLFTYDDTASPLTGGMPGIKVDSQAAADGADDFSAWLETAGASDTTPDAFSFTDQTDVAISTQIESNTITVSGIDAATSITVTGGEMSINSGAYTATSTTVNNGDTVQLRQTSSASNSTQTDVTLDIGGVSDVWSVTTIAAVTGTITTEALVNDTGSLLKNQLVDLVFVQDATTGALVHSESAIYSHATTAVLTFSHANIVTGVEYNITTTVGGDVNTQRVTAS